MTCVKSILRNPFVSMALVAGSVAATGCVDASQPAATETTESTVDHTVISDGAVLSALAPQSIQYQRTADGDKLSVSGPGWTQTAPGEWTNSAPGSSATIKAVPVANALAAPPPPVTCNLNFYIGASTPTGVGFAGEAAIGQSVCLDGAVQFTITTTACTDLFGCITQSGTGVASPGLPFTFGIAVPGTPGAACLGQVIWTPPGASATFATACG